MIVNSHGRRRRDSRIFTITCSKIESAKGLKNHIIGHGICVCIADNELTLAFSLRALKIFYKGAAGHPRGAAAC